MKKPQILIATSNIGKYREMMEVLSVLPFSFITLSDLNLKNEVAETGTTFVENAFLKADFFHQKTGLPTIAEDSGIEVSALAGELGIKTRRWGAGEKATDLEWLDFFLRRMKTEEDRRATFFCTAVFVSGKTRKVFSGKTMGTLLKTPPIAPPAGIPISALFVPDGTSTVFAAMSPKEKNAISHRGKAMAFLASFLKSFP